MNRPKKVTLKNGLPLIIVPMPQVESMTLIVGVGAGSRHEAKRVNGLFHFIEHMAFKGTKKRPSSLAISSVIESVGGEYNAYTNRERTGYYVKLAAKHQELAFDILSDMVLNSLYDPKEIEREKGVIIEELNMYEDTPPRRAWELFFRLIYGDNPMGRDIGGEKENIRRIKRTDFLQYINRLYFPKNMVVVVAGKVTEKKTKELANQYFSQFLRKGKKRTKSIKLAQKKAKTKVTYKKTEQAHFCLGVPGFWYSHPDRFILSVLATVIGGGASSRLFIEIRERRGLAYYVRGEPDFFTDSGYFLARAGVRLKKIDEAVKVCLSEFNKISSQKVGDKELVRAKEKLKGNLVLALEDSRNVAGRYTNLHLLEKKLRTPEETMKLIDKVTAEEVLRVAKHIFKPEKLNLAVIGPYKDEKRFKKLLQ